ncbi:MAG: carbon-nitrogen hydrolase family protein, partial [Acidobacteria bacterium]|nr:carbon-nitrogen hydrolase family protein [Acidobacteriota bacterium]
MRQIMLSLLFLTAASSSAFRAADARKPGQPGRNPIVRVVTVSQAELQRKSNDPLNETMTRLNQAASFQPDIACLPELFANRPPEPVPGPVTARLAAWAREHSAYLVFGLKTRMSGGVYNSAILIDRKGQIIGQYNKIHPTEGELQDGTRPGDVEPLVFETDFGTIGVQICFDVNWWDVWKRLKQKGAKIIFFPSAYPAARQLSALALMNQYYVVSSTMRGSSGIYDISGEVVASSGQYQQWAGAALPLGKRLFETDYHVDKVREIQQKYGSKVAVTWFHDDSWFTLASLDPDLTVEDVISEFGLTPL